MLPMIAGDSAPIYLAARYWLISETLPTSKARKMFFGSDLILESVRKSNTNGIRNIKTDNCNTTLVLRCNTSRLVSLANTSTGVPIAPKAVATLLAIRLTVAENIGLNPKLIRIAAGMATAVPNPAIASNNPPNPHVSSKTWILLSVEIEANCCLIISIFSVFSNTL